MKHHLLLSLSLLIGLSAPALALPGMEITAAKGTLLNRKPGSPVAQEFKQRRIFDLPTFDKLGVGNYHVQYRLDNARLMIWMYVESAPPTVDEVVLFVTPTSPKDSNFARGLKLVDLVYTESNAGAQVVNDLRNAPGKQHKNQYRENMLTYEEKSLLPKAYDGYLYYLGDLYGYKIGHHKGGLEVGIYRKDILKAQIDDVKKRLYPDPPPLPSPPPPPPPLPTPHPKIVW